MAVLNPSDNSLITARKVLGRSAAEKRSLIDGRDGVRRTVQLSNSRTRNWSK